MHSNPAGIGAKLLLQFSEYAEARGKTKPVAQKEEVSSESTSPQERIEIAAKELRDSLIAELLSKLAITDPFRFEQVVLDLLVAMGYGGSRKEAAEVTQKTGDEA